MDLLGRIVQTKQAEVAALLPQAGRLRAEAEAAPPTRGFARSLEAGESVAVIGEYKRRSPSAGGLGGELGPGPTAAAYEAAGASALSVLTDRDYFGGELADLRAARAACGLPVLRKDFVIHAVQVDETRAAGADAVLLIVRVLTDAALRELLDASMSVGLDVLVEVHDEVELARALDAGARLIGVNNRDLSTFRTDLDVTFRLARRVPRGVTLVGESGIQTAHDVERLGAAGVDAVLVGEALMRAGVAGAAGLGLAGRPRVPRGQEAPR